MMVLAPSSAYGQRAAAPLPRRPRGDVPQRDATSRTLVDDILDLSQIDAGRMALPPRVDARWPTSSPRRSRPSRRSSPTAELSLRDAVAGRPARALPRPHARPPDPDQPAQQRGPLPPARRRHGRGAAERDDAVVVAVRDTGPGIPPDGPAVRVRGVPPVGRLADRATSAAGSGWRSAAASPSCTAGPCGSRACAAGAARFFLDAADRASGRRSPRPSADPGRPRGRAGPRPDRSPRVAVVDHDRPGAPRLPAPPRRTTTWSTSAPCATAVRAAGRPAAARGRARRRGRSRALAPARRRAPPSCAGVPMLACPLRTAQRTAEELGAHRCLTKPVARGTARGAPCAASSGRSARAVVVDDDAEMPRLLARMVRSLCHAPRSSRRPRTAREALALVRATRPDAGPARPAACRGLDGYARPRSALRPTRPCARCRSSSSPRAAPQRDDRRADAPDRRAARRRPERRRADALDQERAGRDPAAGETAIQRLQQRRPRDRLGQEVGDAERQRDARARAGPSRRSRASRAVCGSARELGQHLPAVLRRQHHVERDHVGRQLAPRADRLPGRTSPGRPGTARRAGSAGTASRRRGCRRRPAPCRAGPMAASA